MEREFGGAQTSNFFFMILRVGNYDIVREAFKELKLLPLINKLDETYKE